MPRLAPALDQSAHNLPRRPWYRNGSPLANSIVACWPLDEASGTRYDRVGTSHLTDNATVTSAAGISYPLAAEFVIANSEFLSAADSAVLSAADINMWGAGWVRPAAVNVASLVSGKWNTTGNREWQVAQNNADLLIQISPDGTATGNGAVTASSALAANTWLAYMWYHDATNNLIGLSINGGAFSTTSYSAGCSDKASLFTIGRQGSAAAYFGGRQQMVVFGKSYVPTQADSAFFLTSRYQMG